MTSLSYTWLPDGELRVNAPAELEVVAALLDDMKQFPAFLTQAIEAAQRQGEQWSTGGNRAWVDLDNEQVTVSYQHNDDEVSLPREQFLEILEEFQHALATGDPAPR